jgi:hypothetical protein
MRRVLLAVPLVAVCLSAGVVLSLADLSDPTPSAPPLTPVDQSAAGSANYDMSFVGAIPLTDAELAALREEYPLLYDVDGSPEGSNLMMKSVVRATKEDIPRLTATPDSKRLFEQIQACFPPEVSEFFDLFEHASCYEDLVNAAADVMEPKDLINAVKALVAYRPDVLTACHNGGHSAAARLTKRIWNPRDPYEAQLEQLRRVIREADDVCQNGYVHGFYDAIGQEDPNDDSFRAAAEACYEVLSATVDCGHGLGHSAWYATQDFKEAAAVCGVLKGYLKYRCDDGVIMYLPDYWSKGKDGWTADPRQSAWDPDKFYKDAVEVCSWWPQTRAGDDDPLRGCWIGIPAGVLWRPISTLLNYGNYTDVADEAKELIRRAEAACMEFGPRGEQFCIKQWPGMVLYVAQNNENNILDLCSAMVKHKTFCVNKSLAQLAENQARDSETSRVVK